MENTKKENDGTNMNVVEEFYFINILGYAGAIIGTVAVTSIFRTDEIVIKAILGLIFLGALAAIYMSFLASTKRITTLIKKSDSRKVISKE